MSWTGSNPSNPLFGGGEIEWEVTARGKVRRVNGSAAVNCQRGMSSRPVKTVRLSRQSTPLLLNHGVCSRSALRCAERTRVAPSWPHHVRAAAAAEPARCACLRSCREKARTPSFQRRDTLCRRLPSHPSQRHHPALRGTDAQVPKRCSAFSAPPCCFWRRPMPSRQSTLTASSGSASAAGRRRRPRRHRR
jgi:hypothetical protein